MPFLRVIRDKRGYETSYLLHWYREGSRQQSRILYVFRSPGGVRVGRSAFDPDVLRELEHQYPAIEFDWKSVLDHRQVIEPPPEDRRPRKRRRDEAEGGSAPAVAAKPPAEVRAAPRVTSAAAEPRLVVPVTIDGATPDEQVAFIARWHTLLSEQIPKRTADPERQAALLALTARLDPGAWTDAEAITTGLYQAAEALERLSHVFAKRRRRSRKPARRLEGVPPSAAAAAEEPERQGAAEVSSPAEPPLDAPAGPADPVDRVEPE